MSRKKENKLFYQQAPTKNEIQFIKYLAFMYGAKLYLKIPEVSTAYTLEDESLCKAYSVAFKKEIYINLKEINTIQGLFIAFFHELQHCINYDEKKFFNFHKKPESLDDFKRKLSLTLRAEQYTDRQAAKLQKVYAPFIPYISGYTSETVKEVVKFENQISKLLLIINNNRFE